MSGGDEYTIDSFYESQRRLREDVALYGNTNLGVAQVAINFSEVPISENEYAPLSPQDWNLKVGKDVNPEDDLETQFKNLLNEFKRLAEESHEGLDNSEVLNSKEVLDAYCDIKFVFKNLENRLRKYGYDVDGAFEDVCLNNSLKYTTDFKLASSWKRSWFDLEPNLATMLNVTSVDGINYYCVKRIDDDKVLKPPQFESVKLQKYLPEMHK